jgi:chemotaxis protein MotA
MDFSLIVGIIFGFAMLMIGYTIEHGVIMSLVLVSPLIIVLGGTIGATIASYSFKDIVSALKALGSTFHSPKSDNAQIIIQNISEMAEIYRRAGVKELEEFTGRMESGTDEMRLLQEGISLVSMMKTPEEIQYILDCEVRAYVQKKQIEINIWEAASGFSPTMGVIGTVMGLILVLSGGFGDPDKLASSISVAFVATFYGVTFANMLFLPVANKLKTILRRNKIQREMVIDGVCMIARRDLAFNVESALSLYYQAYADGEKRLMEKKN